MDMVSSRLQADETAETELELKLSMSPENLTKLLKVMGKAGGVDPASRKTKRIVSTYFDTEDRRLRRRGLTLRVRDKGGALEQTVKSEGTSVSGVMTRQEWTSPLKSKQPDLTLVKSVALQDRMGLILPQELSALFKTDIKRTTMVVQHSISAGETAKVELAFDRGQIIAGKKRKAVAEVELELISGTMAALIDLARVLAGMVPSVLNMTSKVATGFELRDGEIARASTALKQGMPQGISIEDSMTLVFRGALSHLLLNRSAAASGADIEGVHQARIAIRRIKSALSIYRNVLNPDDVKPFKTGTRWLMDVMGPARDLDVFLDEILAPVMADRSDDTDLLALEEAAKKARTAAYRKVRSALSSARYTRLVLDLAAWIEQKRWRHQTNQVGLHEPLNTIAGRQLSHRRRKVMKTGRGFETMPTDQRHHVRIVLKKLRYSAEFFSGLYPDNQTRPYIAAMKQLQNDLGAANDVAVAEDLTQRLAATARRGTKKAAALQGGAGKVLGWHTRAAAEADKDIVDHWTAFAHSRPFWPSH